MDAENAVIKQQKGDNDVYLGDLTLKEASRQRKYRPRKASRQERINSDLTKSGGIKLNYRFSHSQFVLGQKS